MSEQRDAVDRTVEAEPTVAPDPAEESEAGVTGPGAEPEPTGEGDDVEPDGSNLEQDGDVEDGAEGDAEGGADLEPAQTEASPGDAEQGEQPSGPHRARGPALAAVTALVVLVASAAGYYTVVPKTVKVPSRLAGLVLTHPGIKTFDVKPKAKQQVTPSQSGVTAIKDAAKKSPDQTGGYLVGWEPSSSKVAVVVAFAMPTTGQAAKALTELRHQQLAANAEKANSLTRKATFALRSIPGSAGALFGTKSAKASAPGLALVAFRVGTIVSEAEISGTAQARNEASTLATLQYVHLGRVQRGFSLTKMTYPLLPTLLWGAGTVLLVALIAGSPFLRRRARARADRRRQEALDRQLVLGSTVVMKHRR